MEQFQKRLNDYFSAWNEGLITKKVEGIKSFMSKSFVGYWAHSGIDRPDPYDYEYDLESVLKSMNHAEKSFEAFSIKERLEGKEALVLGRETNMINGEPYTAQCMFVWKKESGQWMLVREYIELER
ncbi:nuclear transport factor 2 family protein [Rossellomorea aquimaris]|uniref:nuclear transport factor 2 family protein n=1 Tax=Rossellomorea aquimaris TaxID=189382 RepID=UPI001CD28724|nr:nuclear transport factor 2 family protein [Rossellomorea aquimaris]MCA1053996.1 nuclear transport factor 2 family protein [Rossellomorea aquimaris]